MYWSHRSLPELKGIPDDEAQRLLLDAMKTARRRPGFWKAVGVACLLASGTLVVFGVAGGVLGISWLPSLGAGVGGAVAGGYYGQFLMEKAREVLREQGYPSSGDSK
jgi:hypothetical protein